jgi:protein SCO1/2
VIRRLAVVLCVAALTAGCAGSSDEATHRHAEGDIAGAVIERPYPLPDQEFTDTSGQPFVPAKDSDRPVTLMFFGYTHCPDVCNAVLANVASALRRVDDSVRDQVQMVFVTTDPDRDTPDVLRGYLDRFDPSYVGLTAPIATVEAAAAGMHIAYAGKETAAAGGYEVSHGTQITAFHEGKARVVWMAETPVRDLRADLEQMVAEPS